MAASHSLLTLDRGCPVIPWTLCRLSEAEDSPHIGTIKHYAKGFEHQIFIKQTMKTLYEKIIDKVAAGAKFSVNYETRSLKVDGKYVVKDGKCNGEMGVPKKPVEYVLNHIEILYRMYRHSIPSERTEAQRKTYFQALYEKDLTDDDMFYGQRREVAQVMLELYVLCAILNGSLNWDEFAKDKWFWQSEKYPTLILLKQWVKH